MEAICILFKMKPDWDTAKVLSDPQLMRRMAEYDRIISQRLSQKNSKVYRKSLVHS
jgi:dynein heavy chain